MTFEHALAAYVGGFFLAALVGLLIARNWAWFTEPLDDTSRRLQREDYERQEEYIHSAMHRIDRAANRPRRVK